MKSKQFSAYADYYDQLYKQKPYKNETDRIEELFKQHSSIPVKKILSLGCGTGTYEILLAKRNYGLTVVDLSKDMLVKARKKIKQAGLTDKIILKQGDIRSLKLNGKFDAVIMMFNIAGYLHTKKDMIAVAKNVSRCLKKGGVFIFDCWYDQAVLADPPTNRTKTIKKRNSIITRITKGSLDKKLKLVKIVFEVTEKKNGKKSKQVKEEHPMRHWGINELKETLKRGGLYFVTTSSFDNLDEPVSSKKWNMLLVAKKE